MKKVLLTILDGWGIDKNKEYNAIEIGHTPNWHRILEENPNSKLITFGKDVGLPEGQMGNSEVGHTNIGAGRVVFQELPRINNAIKDQEFEKKNTINNALKIAKEKNATVHIMGLFSNGGIHSHMDHFIHSINIFAKENISVILHPFTDGRDTPPTSAISFLESLDSILEKHPNVKIGSICGRYYSMDRDNRWERIELAYNAIALGKGEKFNNYKEALESSYNNKITDEFVHPCVIEGYEGMQNDDIIFMINFRTDRAREILNALVLEDFNNFTRQKSYNFSYKLGMVNYSDILNQELEAVFAPNNLENSLGQWLSKNNVKQLRMAETEKYPHVTFFFNCGREKEFENEKRILVSSPKVATYDLKPEMSAYEITENLIKELDKKEHDFIVVNYANGDMVGHTGILEAAAKAAEAVDNCLETLEKSVLKNDYIWLIIADHGNCETMWDEKNNVPHTQHTTNLVNAILINSGSNITLEDGKLADIAPTILELIGIKQPQEMNGISLLKK